MWVNRLTHTLAHTGKCAERVKEERRGHSIEEQRPGSR